MKNNKNKKGFSLVEVLVSLLVLAIGTAGVFFLMTNSLKISKNSKNQVIGSMLAQEGVELVRNLRDNKKLQNPPYDAGTGVPFSVKVQTDPANVKPIINDDDNTANKLYLTSNLYTHDSSGTPTKFYRTINVSIDGDINASPYSTRVITTTSFVTWNDAGFTSFPPNIDNCTLGNQCVYATSVMADML
jgi:type IV pilus modification protein PilV